MATKVKELVSNPMHKKGDDPNCSICHPRDKIPHWKVWRQSLRTKIFPLKNDVKV